MGDQSQANNKRIAKNTLLLYFRMILLMGISFYTSRVVLDALGESDFGTYNVVGGVVSMFAVLSGSLSASISRFLTYEMGSEDKSNLNKIFSTAITIQIILSFIIVVVAETIGLWFLNNKMNIPLDRMSAANSVFQISIFTFVVNLISVPYNASIVAHEKMSAFAYISILEGLGNLAIAFMIFYNPIDRLVYYAILIALLALFVRMVYGWYCKSHFEECEYHFVLDKSLLKQMFGFAGWNFIGASSAVLRDHGGNILLNLFFDTTLNAARGVTVKVSNAVNQFVGNFMTAINPQITKMYASGNYEYMFKLIFQGARLSFYILLLISLPVILNADYLLSVWLKEVPEHTTIFVQLALIFSLSECISHPLVTAMLATGQIRNYQIVVGGLQMMNLPISYVMLKLGSSPVSVYVVAIVVSQLCLAARLYMLRGLIGLSVREYLRCVYFNVIIVALSSAFIPLFIHARMSEGLLSFVVVSVSSVVLSVLSMLFIGSSAEERAFVYAQLGKMTNKFTKK